MNYSPLRYPGGKNKLAPFIAHICQKHGLDSHYVEPYCGGAAVGLFLLINNYVKRITINDKDISIYSFWYSILNHTNEFIERIRNVNVTVDEWDVQRKYQYCKGDISLFDLGFSTFFMNRTNRSGIIMGGMIGGREQKGKYKIDCRFNKEELIKRIEKIAERKDSISISNLDAIKLISKVSLKINQSSLVYLDPPYFKKADSLYLNHYDLEDHREVSLMLANSKLPNWIVSYDNVLDIKKLYSKVSKLEYTFKHTAYNTRVGEEILFFSKGLKSKDISGRNPVNYKHIKRKTFSKIIYIES